MSVAEVSRERESFFADDIASLESRTAFPYTESRPTITSVSRSGVVGQASSSRARLEQQAQKLELLFIKKFKSSLLGIFAEWQKNFNPNAPYGIYYISTWLNSVIKKESNSSIESFLKDIQAATTRRKIAKLMQEQLRLIENGRAFVDQPTANKLDEATRILVEQLAKLAPIPPKTEHAGVAREFPKVQGEGDLAQKKKVVYESMKAWKESLKVAPAYVLSYIPGVAEILQTKADVIYANFVKQISRVSTASEFCSIMERLKDRMVDFRAFIDTAAAEQVDLGVKILADNIRLA